MRITVQSNFPDIAKRISEFGKQAEFAAAVALTKTAQNVRDGIQSAMASAFDRPTKYTLNSLFVRGATKSRLEALVWLKDAGGKGTPADRYLAAQIEGGSRRMKGIESMLQRAGMMSPSQFVVPGMSAQIDGFGNVKRSQIVQVLSQLKLQRGAGFESRATGSTRSKRTIAKQGQTYFVISTPTRGLQPGVYLKRKFAHGSAIKPVFLFVSKVNYSQRLKFYETGDAIVSARFPGHFDEQLGKAIASAKLK